MQYQNDYVVRLVEQLGFMIRRASMSFREADYSSEPFEVTNEAIGLVTDMDPGMFLTFSPQSMVSFIEISGFDDRVVLKLAQAIELQADILETEGSIVIAGVRRDQAAAIAESIDPLRAN